MTQRRNLLFLVMTFFSLCAEAGEHPLNKDAAIRFVKNEGQWKKDALYQASLPGGRCIITRKGITYDFHDPKMYHELMRHPFEHGTDLKNLKKHCLKLSFNTALLPEPREVRAEHYNYFLGRDKTKWKSNVRAYSKLLFTELYPGINMELYAAGAGMKYDLIVKPGADPARIKLSYEGADKIEILGGRLLIKTSVNQVIEEAPFAYQVINGKKVEIGCHFELNGTDVSFVVADYNKNFQLVIDPVLIFSTYSGSTADNFGFTATYDSHGNLYAGGITSLNEGGDYPVTPGAYQEAFAGGNGSIGVPGYINFPCDITISKYDSSGQNLLYATYLGGASNEYPHSLIVDSKDNLLVFGSTYSSNFPYISGSFDSTHGGQADIIVCKFSTDGSQLLASTYLGGAENDGVNISSLKYNYADEFRGEINIDANDNIYIAACSKSLNFPVTANAFQSVKNLKQDGVIFQMDNDLKTMIWGSFFGGPGDDAVYSVDVSSTGDIIIAGGSDSIGLPTTANVISGAYKGKTDGFAGIIARQDKKIKHLTYFGTNEYDQVYFAELDDKNYIYITGQTEGLINPSPGVYNNPTCGQFICKLEPDLSNVVFQTVIGSRPANPDFSPCAFLVDKCENIYLSGWGSDIGLTNVHTGNTAGLPVTPNPLQPTTDGNDFYLIVLGKNATNLLYATFFGGDQSEDHVDGGTSRFDKNGIVYQSVCASCPGTSDFPTTLDAFAEFNVSPRCSNAAFKIDFQITNAVDAFFIAEPLEGCLPLQVSFTNKSKSKKSKWDFGDGTPADTTWNPVHTYTKPGIYNVMLVVTDSLSCNINDTFYRQVRAFGESTAQFNVEIRPCDLEVAFKNTSNNALTFLWDFGDGSLDSINFSPKKLYADTGLFTVTLYTNRGTPCSDSIRKNIHVNPLNAMQPLFTNAFSPNGDGTNDCFRIFNLSAECDSVHLIIYNRWGEQAFKSDDVEKCWDGTKENSEEEYPESVYYYVVDIIRFKNDPAKMIKYHRTGTITLLR